MTEKPTRHVDQTTQSNIDPGSPGDIAVRVRTEMVRPAAQPDGQVARSTLEKSALLVGRAIFGGYFLYNGINHFTQRNMMVEYARAKGTPAAEIAVPATGAMLLAGGLSVLAGTQPKVGAALIAAFLLGVSPRMHAFWKEQDAQQRMQEMVNFTKNMALVGATLFVAAHPEPWTWRVA